MKICIISNLYPPHDRGGAELIVAWTAEKLFALGHEVSVIYTKPSGGLEQDEYNHVKTYRFKPLNFFYYTNLAKHSAPYRILWHVADMFNLHSAIKVRQVLKQEKPDLVITHNLKGLGFIIPMIIRGLKIKHYHVLHDVQLAVPSGLIIKGKEKSFMTVGAPIKLYATLSKLLFGSPEKIISPSRWLLDYYAKKRFFPRSEKTVLRNPLKNLKLKVERKTKKQNHYLFVGQIEKHKGVEWLIDWWRKNEIKDELLIVGRGSEQLRLQSKAAGTAIKFLGVKFGRQIGEVFARVDFLIMPSLCYENSPTVIPLAMQHGVPVLSAKIGGAGESVAVGKTGYLFEAGDYVSFGKAFSASKSLSDENFAVMGDNCLKQAENYQIEPYLRELLSS